MANVNKPRADPNSEMINNAFRPNVSENVVVHNVPMICTTAIAIDDT